MPSVKENFLPRLIKTNTAGLVFMFAAVISLGIALFATGTIALTDMIQRRNHKEYAKTIIYQPSVVKSASSNEQANPAVIGLFLDNKYAGAIIEDGSFAAAETPPAQGPLSILLMNPNDTGQPTSVRFPAQKITITDDTGTVTACLPAMDGNRLLWVDKSGNTYLDPALTLRARSC